MSSEKFIQDYSSLYYKIRYSGYGLKYHTFLIEKLMKGMTGRGLDCGCGVGLVSKLYPNIDITGIDISDGMLASNNGKWVKMDAQAMTFERRWFDFILCRSLLHHLPDHQQGLSEMRRVLKPGGKVAFLETNQSWLATQVRQRTQHGDRFSAFHRSFKDTELIRDIERYFVVDEVRYEGFLQYPIYGFPDILDIAKYVPLNRFVYPLTGMVDSWLSQVPMLRRLSWALLIRAHKI